MLEFGFELALCARLEREREAVVSRQLDAAVRGRRVIDTVLVEPGPRFAERAALSPETIPPAAIESRAGPGRARPLAAVFDCSPERARELADRAVAAGFFERERRGGRTFVRQTVRYPERWFGRIVGIENKPDLDRPGALRTQLLTDTCLGLLDAVVLATRSHVTGAHLNRLPDAVGVWEFDPPDPGADGPDADVDAGDATAPADGDLRVVREPSPLSTDAAGVEIRSRRPERVDVRIATAEEKARARRALAERAYGKGWRSYDLPTCARLGPDADGLPYCPWKGRLVRAATDCGADCPGHESADPPELDREQLRAERTLWDPDPDGGRRRQSGLDQFG